jgi:serine/threonine protein kinase
MEVSEEDFKIPLKLITNLKEIGNGTSAVVFKGKYNNEFVALKVFKSNLLEENSEDFKKELKLVSKLKNANIVNFIGFMVNFFINIIFFKFKINIFLKVEETQFGIVLEFCENGSLKTYLESNKNLNFKIKLKILIDISKGMEYIHFKKLIHRDLKLDNVLLTKDGTAKISDFGISRSLTDKTNSKTMRVGTALYMAPEVILTNNYDQKCDIFSFSIMMFQVFTNKIENIYDNEILINEKKIELKEIDNNEIEFSKKILPTSFNIELKVSNDPNFRPIVSNLFDSGIYLDVIELMKNCWKHLPNERPNFFEITIILEEILKNFEN